MVLKMTSFNIMEVHRKIRFIGGRSSRKPSCKTNILGEFPKNGRFGQFADLRGGAWQKIGDRVFEGREGGMGLKPQCTLFILNA